MITISSQRYIDDEIVQSKIDDADFDVLVSPEFEYDGQVFRVVLDGHHSLAAAKAAGEKPNFIVADSGDHDAVALIESGDVEDFLQVTHMGDDYYNVDTEQDIW